MYFIIFENIGHKYAFEEGVGGGPWAQIQLPVMKSLISLMPITGNDFITYLYLTRAPH